MDERIEAIKEAILDHVKYYDMRLIEAEVKELPFFTSGEADEYKKRLKYLESELKLLLEQKDCEHNFSMMLHKSGMYVNKICSKCNFKEVGDI